MKLRALFLHEPFVIDGYITSLGGPERGSEQSFHVDDGWDLRRLEAGAYTVQHSTMAEPVGIDTTDASYRALVELPPLAYDGLILEGEKGPIEVIPDPQHSDLLDGPARIVQMHPKKGKRH